MSETETARSSRTTPLSTAQSLTNVWVGGKGENNSRRNIYWVCGSSWEMREESLGMEEFFQGIKDKGRPFYKKKGGKTSLWPRASLWPGICREEAHWDQGTESGALLWPSILQKLSEKCKDNEQATTAGEFASSKLPLTFYPLSAFGIPVQLHHKLRCQNQYQLLFYRF